MSANRAIWTVAAFFAGASVVAIVGGPQISSAVDGIAGQGLAIMAGAAITSIGVLLAMQGWIWDSLNTVAALSKADQIANALDRLDSLTRELREDVLALLALTVIAMSVPVVRVMDVPGVVWPFQMRWLSKTTALNSVAICATSLSVYVVVDILNAMFTIHRHCTVILRNHMRLVTTDNDGAARKTQTGSAE